MILGYHGGGCCGIINISGMGDGPDDRSFAILRTTTSVGLLINPRKREIRKDRLTYLLSLLKARYPEGLVEVTLNNFQKKKWHKTLLSLGFKSKSTFKNVNSGNFVTVYHIIHKRK